MVHNKANDHIISLRFQSFKFEGLLLKVTSE